MITPTTMPTAAIATVRTELPAPDANTLASLHEREHPGCFACGTANAAGLGLVFQLSPDGETVVAEWRAPGWAVSYDGTVHGGLIATVLDGAMVHVLFARGCSARTADLRIRYRHPVLPSAPCSVSARLLGTRGPSFQLEAAMHQAGRLCARASATFMGKVPAGFPSRSNFPP